MTMSKDNEQFAMDTAYRRASTAQVDIAEIRSRVSQLRGSILSREDLNEDIGTSGICEFDLSKNVLDYLPHPVISARPQSANSNKSVASSMYAAQSMSMNTLLGNSKFLGLQSENSSHALGEGVEDLDMDPPFKSMFGPTDMRLLALVSHNNMKHAMKQFVIANKNVLKKFRLTGTNTTMTMLREVFGDDPEVVYGPSCKSGPLGGDAQLVAMAVTGQLGGCIFFIDPMDAHPHSADIECLVRQGNVHNILMMNNPTTAHICLNTLRIALKMGRMEMFPSFFFDLESPSVEAYKMRQKAVLQSAIQHTDSAEEMTSLSLPQKDSVSRVPPSRDAEIENAMERANRLSLQFRSSLKKVSFDLNERHDVEDFLPKLGEKDDVSINVQKAGKKGSKDGKKKATFGFFKKMRVYTIAAGDF